MWQLCSSIPSTLPDPKAVSLMTAKVRNDFWRSDTPSGKPATLESHKLRNTCTSGFPGAAL